MAVPYWGPGEGKGGLPYSWHTLPAGAGWAEQVHAESEEEQGEPAVFRQVEPVPQNTVGVSVWYYFFSLVFFFFFFGAVVAIVKWTL